MSLPPEVAQAGKPDTAHQQLIGWVVDTDHPGFDSVLARTGKPPLKPVYQRITPFWEYTA